MVIFVCGVVTGALVIKTQGGRPSFPAASGRFYSIGPPGLAPVDAVVRQLKDRLALTTNQCGQIVRIMQDSQTTNAAIRKNIAPLLQKEVDRAHQAITNCLTSEQQIKYADLLKEHDQRPGGRGEGSERGPGIARRRSRKVPAEHQSHFLQWTPRSRTRQNGPEGTQQQPFHQRPWEHQSHSNQWTPGGGNRQIGRKQPQQQPFDQRTLTTPDAARSNALVWCSVEPVARHRRTAPTLQPLN